MTDLDITNLDIINDQILTVLFNCKAMGLLSEIQFDILRSDLKGIVDGSIDERVATEEEIEFNRGENI